ncbi:VCBS domain-containing protein [Vibrio lentus]|nr:VCBS domain-containing protein [Vibrio lentus]
MVCLPMLNSSSPSVQALGVETMTDIVTVAGTDGTIQQSVTLQFTAAMMTPTVSSAVTLANGTENTDVVEPCNSVELLSNASSLSIITIRDSFRLVQLVQTTEPLLIIMMALLLCTLTHIITVVYL